ncbi:MAG TPA: HNH endonuclease [Candidatus Marinimicrobia bacterium]|jgi:putative restriction endonuclease|nr:HNH endonuclease [Candidatus Neomarinimicrobiota bacterium]|tara:strand:- start:86 stop:967 length:882 start_codon:yes stop_codon:yes gene_type:complete
MSKGILTAKAGSRYDDVIEERYHFPQTYLNQARQMVNDWIIYYEPGRVGAGISGIGRKAYFAIARINSITEDQKTPNHYYAWISDFLEFANAVPFRLDGNLLESYLQNDDGLLNRGAMQRSVRTIPDDEFNQIVKLGFVEEQSIVSNQVSEPVEEYKRDIIQSVITRPVRDVTFKYRVREVYNSTCAVTGLHILNGGGKPEVEAAHIQPVGGGHNGPDSVRNGIALSRTIHWLFDRGMISLNNDYEILTASKAVRKNTSGLIEPGRPIHLPNDMRFAPHTQFLDYHRENIFKG